MFGKDKVIRIEIEIKINDEVGQSDIGLNPRAGCYIKNK